jgi:hypothetical protein
MERGAPNSWSEYFSSLVLCKIIQTMGAIKLRIFRAFETVRPQLQHLPVPNRPIPADPYLNVSHDRR